MTIKELKQTYRLLQREGYSSPKTFSFLEVKQLLKYQAWDLRKQQLKAFNQKKFSLRG